MQTNTWLIQNIGNPDKAGTDLGSKTDSLCLSARQSTSGTCQGKVLQTYICQEPNSGSDLL